MTDGGNHIADCAVGEIADASRLQADLRGLVGVIETGLFIGLASHVIVARVGGVEVIER